MNNSPSTPEAPTGTFENEADVCAHLEAAMREHDAAALVHALADIVRARNLTKVKGMRGKWRSRLLSGADDMPFAQAMKLMQALGVRLVFKVPAAPEAQGSPA
jgi:DNA-binding phage protein